MTRDRPIGVTILAILAGIAALVAIYHTLQLLGLLPISGPFGIFNFFTFNLLGALVWGILALIYLWVVRMLWHVDVRGNGSTWSRCNPPCSSWRAQGS